MKLKGIGDRLIYRSMIRGIGQSHPNDFDDIEEVTQTFDRCIQVIVLVAFPRKNQFHLQSRYVKIDSPAYR